MKTKPSFWTIALIFLSIYLVYLSGLGYYASIDAEKYADEQFELGLNETGHLISTSFAQNLTLEEFKIAQAENTIKEIQNEIDDNFNMDRWIDWRVNAKIYLLMAILSIIMTILSWRIDNLKKKV